MNTAIVCLATLLVLTFSTARSQLVVPSYERRQPLILCGGAAPGQELTVPFDLINTGASDLLIDSAVAAGDTTEFFSNRSPSDGARYLNPILWHFIGGKTLAAGSSAFAAFSFTPMSSGDKSLDITVYYHDGPVAKTTRATVTFHTLLARPGIGFLHTRVDTVRNEEGGYAVVYDRVLTQDTLALTDTVVIGDSLTLISDPPGPIYLTTCGPVSIIASGLSQTGPDEDLFTVSALTLPHALATADTLPVDLRYIPFSLTPQIRTAIVRYAADDGSTAVLKLTIVVVDRTSGVEEERGAPVAAGSAISGAPNPFTGSTMIALHFPRRVEARLTVTDGLGREVALLHDGPVEPGAAAFRFDATGLPAGVYFARVRYGDAVAVGRLVLIR